MRSGGASAESTRADGARADGDVAEQFRAVLDAEEHWLAKVSCAGDLAHWRMRVVREVMDRRSPYALALRRGQGSCRQGEFLRCWQVLIARTLERVGLRQADRSPGARSPTGAVTEDSENLAVAILAALHGGATLSWLADDRDSLEAALDIALAPVMVLQRPDAPRGRRSD
ncbi:hypothetical protein [Myceligenerans pegani]|uniref:TetR family transcriptional regulator n=1 Tax=Myceligenerans pegani TaxID=2776917 RepID=A0ABR9MZU8_9MICO|nr:hypothetical protein [Myceligenerans sp. TRM 65318]MBE1876551.1 hypothetical protein [Myceligenerans sp. TRM 65318]MBE3018822.1 hypothetical protein [Myceligenerans sp. TRM 65318]